MYKLPPTPLTDDQEEWFKQEKERTGNPYTAILRSLVQEKIDKAHKEKMQQAFVGG